jgi:prepilin-type N-terminal cleavage/methylation domain-containing protein
VRRRRQAGFTLVETLVALVLLVLVLAIAAQLLGETQQMLVDASRELRDPAAALVATRLRADVLGATAAVAVQNPDLSCAYVELIGSPRGPIVYRLAGGGLVRSYLAADGTPHDSMVLLRPATWLACATFDPPLASFPIVRLDYRYLRSRVRRSPLPLLPSAWAPRQEEARETLFLTPRGAGLGEGW